MEAFEVSPRCRTSWWNFDSARVGGKPMESLMCEQLGLAPAEIMGKALRTSTLQISIVAKSPMCLLRPAEFSSGGLKLSPEQYRSSRARIRTPIEGILR